MNDLYAAELEEATRRAEEEAARAALPVPLPSPSEMPEEFAKSTLLALRAQQEILSMELVESDGNYRAKLQAKASVAAQQINAQLKADEQRLKGEIARVSFYADIKRALAEYRNRSKDGD